MRLVYNWRRKIVRYIHIEKNKKPKYIKCVKAQSMSSLSRWPITEQRMRGNGRLFIYFEINIFLSHLILRQNIE